MFETTSIDAPNLTISTTNDETVAVLDFEENKKIFFLPLLISESFPKLVVITALDCSVTSISKENFQNLQELTDLYLGRNKIKNLPSNTFEDLKKLKMLKLQNNQIESIDDKVFEDLESLEELFLSKNRICFL